MQALQRPARLEALASGNDEMRSGFMGVEFKPIAAPGVKVLLRALLAWALMVLPPAAQAIPPNLPLRELAYQSWGQEAGLPQISVRDLAFDPQGFVWIGTENGLAKFDGSHFQIFHQKDAPALKSSWISRLYFDRAGRLWIGTIKNLAVYRDSAFAGVTAQGKEVGKVNGLAEDAVGDLYVAADGLFLVHDGSMRAVPGWTGPATSALAAPGAVWIAAPGHISRFRGGERRDFILPPTQADAVVANLAWSEDCLWLATTRGLLRLQGEQFEVVSLEPGTTQPSILGLGADGAGALWASSDKMLYRLDHGRLIERIAAKDPGALAWPITIKAGPDDIWFGSQTEGLQHSWISGAHRISTDNGLPDPAVWSYAADGARVLVGTNSGVAAIEAGQAKPYIPGDALPNPVAYTLLRDADQRLWVGTRAGLARFKPNGQADRTLPEFAGIQINGLAQDRAGVVWAATTAGLFRIDGDRVQQCGESMGLPTTRFRFVLQTSGGDFWVGSENGLYRRQGERFRAVVPDGLAGAFITSILELDQGRLAVGTYEQGIFILDRKGWRHWGTDQGLPSSSVFFLGASDRWLIGAGADGVYRITLKALDRTAEDAPLPVEVLVGNPGEHQGRARIRCCNGAGNSKGMLIQNAAWLPTLDGALQVRIDGPPQLPPKAYIIGIDHAHTTLAAAPEVVLDGLPRDAVIQYGAIDYKQTSHLQFRYRLTGFDKDWSDARGRHTAGYTNLPPGRFSLEVEARRAYEAWGPPVSMTLEVPRMFSETWWFRMLSGLFGVFLIALVMHWRLRRLSTQKLALESVVAARTRELAEINSRLEQANNALQEMSVTDVLTGLNNRRFLEQTIPQLIAKLARRRSESGRDLVLGVMLIDIDHFKSINDRFGHAIGDLVLQRAASALRASVRDGECVLRWGGEEFLAIIDTSERSQLHDIAQRLHRAIAESCEGLELVPGHVFEGITSSIGYSALPISSASAELVWEDAIELADHALYAAKASGRDRCMTVEPEQLPVRRWRNNRSANDSGSEKRTGQTAPG